jgi:hypothetical protein
VEVILERLGVFPLFDEHDPELILEVTVNTVQDAPRLQARALNVRQAQLQDAVDRVWPSFDAASHNQHVTMVPKRVIFGFSPSGRGTPAAGEQSPIARPRRRRTMITGCGATPVPPETTKRRYHRSAFAIRGKRQPKILGWRLRAVRRGKGDLP